MLTKQTYGIVGMKCARCAAEVTKRLHTIEGVAAAHVDYTAGTVEILMRGTVDMKNLQAALRDMQCRIISYIAPAEEIRQDEYRQWITPQLWYDHLQSIAKQRAWS